MHLRKSTLAAVVTMFSLGLGSSAHGRDLVRSGHEAAPIIEVSEVSGYTRASASWWPAHDDMGEAGYFGGSSGGIPGTGATDHRSAYENDEVGIPPEDRPYPVWTQPGRLLR